MKNSSPVKVTLAAAGGLAYGAACAWLALVSAPGNAGMVAHAAGVISRMIGGWWGWGAMPIIAVALLVARSWKQGWAFAATFLGSAVLSYYVMDPIMGIAFDTRSLLVWAVGTAVVSPVMGLLGWAATRREAWGTAVRVLVPLAAIAEVLLVPGQNILQTSLGWRDLAAGVVMIALSTLWAIVALGVGGHAAPAVRQPIATPASRIKVVPAA